jgi:NAD(P)H dehydrogenase (quinone)
VTTGADAVETGPGGKEGDTRLLLWPLAYTLRYCGMQVADPVLAHGVHGFHTGAAKAALERRLAGVLTAQPGVIATLDTRATLPFNADSEFDAAGRLRPGAPEHWPFIRQTGRVRGPSPRRGPA